MTKNLEHVRSFTLYPTSHESDSFLWQVSLAIPNPNLNPKYLHHSESGVGANQQEALKDAMNFIETLEK